MPLRYGLAHLLHVHPSGALTYDPLADSDAWDDDAPLLTIEA